MLFPSTPTPLCRYRTLTNYKDPVFLAPRIMDKARATLTQPGRLSFSACAGPCMCRVQIASQG